MSIPKTIVDKAEAENKTDELYRENVKPKRTFAQSMGLESFDDEGFKEEFEKTDESIVEEYSFEEFANNREMFATHRDYGYNSAGRKYLYIVGLRDKRRVQFIGSAVAARNMNVNPPAE